MTVVFESASLLAVDKPTGFLTIPGRKGDRDPRPCLLTMLRQDREVIPVHRLDFEVSGLVLFAKTAEAHRLLSQEFETRRVKKIYEAWTEGELPQAKEFLWESKLLRGKKRAYESRYGKPSQTKAFCLGEEEYRGVPCLSWRIEPLTGRSHQIRFHLSQHGFPIVGDILYGAKDGFFGEAIALRAVSLEFSSEAVETLELPKCLQVSGLRPWINDQG